MNLIGWNWFWPLSRFSRLDRHLDHLHCCEKLQTKTQKCWLFSSKNFSESDKKPTEEKKQRGRAIFGRFNLSSPLFASKVSARVQTSCMKQIIFPCFPYMINILLTKLSVCIGKSLPRSGVQTLLHLICTVLTTLVKIPHMGLRGYKR